MREYQHRKILAVVKEVRISNVVGGVLGNHNKMNIRLGKEDKVSRMRGMLVQYSTHWFELVILISSGVFLT